MKHIYNKDHQEGIHDVTGAPERVIVDQAWSVDIPEGFSYCADRSMTVCDVNGYNYMLQIQKTEDADFNEAYGSEVSLSVYGQFGAINHYNLDALEIEDHLMGMLSVNPDSKIVKYSKDIFVAYYSLYGVTYCFQVYAAGKNRIYTGQITCADDISAEECRQYLESFLDTIEPVTVAELAEADTLVALDDSYLPDFEDCRYIEFGDNLRIPVPNGFDSRIDLDANPCLVIAPEDFDFTESPLKAKITFCISDFSEVPEAFDRQKSMGFINTFMDFLNVSAKTTLFHRANGIYTTRADEKGIILNSYVTNNDCTISQSPTLIFTGKESVYCYVLLSYDLPIADDHDTQWDVRQITTSS